MGYLSSQWAKALNQSYNTKTEHAMKSECMRVGTETNKQSIKK